MSNCNPNLLSYPQFTTDTLSGINNGYHVDYNSAHPESLLTGAVGYYRRWTNPKHDKVDPQTSKFSLIYK